MEMFDNYVKLPEGIWSERKPDWFEPPPGFA
jgi:hypothetical protein